MQKTDESIRKICIASIKRHTIKPINYPLTSIFETQPLKGFNNTIATAFEHEEGELPIVMTFVDNDNWTLLTTKKIISRIKGDINHASATSITSWKFNDFKGFKDKPITYGYLLLEDATKLDIIIETGAPSMMMIYGIMTLTQLTTAPLQIEKTLSRYIKRGFFEENN